MKSPKIPRSNKDERAARDAAYLRSQQTDLLTGTTPSLSNVPELPMIQEVPDACSSCSRRMALESGWTAIAGTTAGHGVLQCGNCGHSISVPIAVYTAYRAQMQTLADARIAAMEARKPKKRNDRRTRGAG